MGTLFDHVVKQNNMVLADGNHDFIRIDHAEKDLVYRVYLNNNSNAIYYYLVYDNFLINDF